MALLLAGLPQSVPGSTVNRLCGSGLDAIAIAAHAITAGDAEFCIAGGVESMSRAPFVMPKASARVRPGERRVTIRRSGWRFVNRTFAERFGVDSMPETAENVATEFSISREDQDAFALRSQQRTAAAIAAGRFAEEIAPVTLPAQRGASTAVDTDEQPRPDTTLAKLAALRAPFRPGGSVTAGNASGINDGAAAAIVASEAAVGKYGLHPRARIVASASAGVSPRIMGMGPLPAVRKVLALTNLALRDIDVIELNEAFAAQALAVLAGARLAGRRAARQ